jgi:hypothetical protein
VSPQAAGRPIRQAAGKLRRLNNGDYSVPFA